MTVFARAIAHVESRSSGPALDPALRVTLNFHPDRVTAGVPILAALGRERVYSSQFVTGTSNGGLTAHPGGDRWNWESRIFGGAYDEAEPGHRPVYGALNFRRRSVGAAPRFGSAHFRLTAEAAARTTFCFPDSAEDPADFGTARRMGLIELASRDRDRQNLDDYIEAHVHGPVRVESDVEALVLDPCYQGTDVEVAAELLPCPVEWHRGFLLRAETLAANPAFRSPEIVRLGQEIAVDGWLDPRILGAAAATGRHDPQQLKYVWHYLAKFGAPR
ncbi:MAG TPA: DUF3626 domain-containing protein [Actinospica sp.]|nr:DUF3626 domain-containing protein [Actinospica sp.]